MRDYYARNKDRLMAQNMAAEAKRKAQGSITRRIGHVRRAFAVSTDEARRLEAVTACEICCVPKPPHKALDVDHDHVTGRVRGKLCHSCNIGLGAFKDDPVLLETAIIYLQERT